MKKLLFVMTFTMLLAGVLFAQNPPTNLTYTLADHDVTLAWDAPQNGGGAEGILRYDNGENADGIGTGEANDFDIAIRFEPAALEEYAGSYLSQIEFFPREANCEYSIKVWTGANAENLVVEQLVSNVTIDAWNLVTLDTPVQIDASQELWFGYRANTQTGYPGGVDAGCRHCRSRCATRGTGRFGGVSVDPGCGGRRSRRRYDTDWPGAVR